MKTLTTILLFLILTSCSKQENGYHIQTIKPDAYFSELRVRTIEDNVIEGTAILGPSCTYDLPDYPQTNKLDGMFQGLNGIHKNSARVGWRCVDESYYVLSAYCYVDSQRYDADSLILDTIGISEEFAYRVETDKYGYTVGVNGHSIFIRNEVDKVGISYGTNFHFGGKYKNPNKEKMKLLTKKD